MINIIGIFPNPTKNNWLTVTSQIVEFLRKRKKRVVMDPEFLSKYPVKGAEADCPFKNSDMIITLGGDGTLLNAIRNIKNYNLPLVGVNLGGLGFLTEFTTETLFRNLEKALSGNYSTYKRTMLQGNLVRNSRVTEKHVALNDVVISQRNLARLLTMNIYINKEYVTTYQADGLIICTPTGSTAYSLSAGGPIVEPTMDAILLTPICPHTLTNRPILIPANSKLRIEFPKPENEVALTIDGQIGILMKKGDAVEVKRHSKQVKLVKSEESSFFSILRKKFGWGGLKGFDNA